jgi:hypothetical protein
MKTTVWILIGAFLWTSHAYAEGAWNVDGHSFTNVHAWQNGNEVCVSGRVSGGKAKAPLRSWIHVRGDDFRSYKALVRIERFTGQGETFEARVKVAKASKWWRIERIEIEGVERTKQRPTSQSKNGSLKQSPGPQSPQSAASLTSFPLKTESAHDMPTVLFSSRTAVCLTIRERDTGRLMVMKNIAPNVPGETRLPIGEYSAHVAGTGFDFKKRFAVMRGKECLEINLSADVME